MQSFRKIVRTSFEIVSGTGDLDVVYFHQLGAGPYPRLKDKSPSKRRGHLGECGGVDEGICHTSSKGMPRHAHGRWALMFVCGRQLECFEMSVMCKFHIKTYQISNSQFVCHCFRISAPFLSHLRFDTRLRKAYLGIPTERWASK